MVNARVFDGERRIDAWPADSRGVAYGDGLFETMRVHAGNIPWWDAHWRRLAAGAHRLRMPLPDPSRARAEAAALFEDGGDGVLKLLVSRAAGSRGYSPSTHRDPAWMIARFPLPESVVGGLRARWCETRVSLQPALAGFKHCNRLEQILARAECDDAGMDEGLMLDIEGNVVGATSANLFVLGADGWLTPQVDRCGVAGVCRAHLLVTLDARQVRLSVADVEGADAVFLSNAVRGILPLAQLATRDWPPHAAIAAAQQKLAALHPGFAIVGSSATEQP
jgi:4-amino-4-deoxychorismate lyase